MHLFIGSSALIVFLIPNPVFADRVTNPETLRDLDRFFPAPTNGGNEVEQELNCIRAQAQRRYEDELAAAQDKRLEASHANKNLSQIPLPLKPSILSAESGEMIKHLSKPMQASFDSFQVNPFERAFFYSQAIEETGAFTMLSESKTMARTGADAIKTVLANVSNDEHFTTNRAATTSNEFGVYRGRGIIQISRCDNYLSIVHYLNLFYAGKKPVWKSDWNVGEGDDQRQLGAVCNHKDLAEFANEYPDKYGDHTRFGNLFGALDDPMRFAMVNAELTDPRTKKKIDSEKFMMDASLAYWRGRCVDTPEKAASPQILRAQKVCSGIQGRDDLSHAVQCLTRCVRGTTEGWEKRMIWMKDALLCVKL